MILCDCHWCLTPDDLYCPMCGQCVVLFGNEALETARGAPIDLFGYRVESDGTNGTGKTKFIVKNFIRHKHNLAGNKYAGLSLFDQIMGTGCFRTPDQMRLLPNFGDGNLDVLLENGHAENHSATRTRFSLEHPFLLGQLNFYFNIVKEPLFSVVFSKYNTGIGDNKFAFSYYWPKISQNGKPENKYIAILPYYLKGVVKDEIDDFQIAQPDVDVVANDKKIVFLKKEIITPEDFAKKNIRFPTDAVGLGFQSDPSNKIKLLYIEFKFNEDTPVDKDSEQKIFELEFRFQFVWKYKKDGNSGSNTFSQIHKVVLLKLKECSLIPDYSADRNTDMYPVSTRGHCEKNFIAKIKFSISSVSKPILDLIRSCPFFLGSVSLDLGDKNLVIDTFDLANRTFKEIGFSANEISFETKIKIAFSLNPPGESKFSEGYDLVSTLHFYGPNGWVFASEKISLRFEKFKVIHEFVSFDFGTTNSCAVYWENSEPVYLQWGDKNEEISSVVYANDHALIDKVELNGWVCGKSVEKKFDPTIIKDFGIPNLKKLFQNSLRNHSSINIVDVHNCTSSHDSEIALAGVLKQFLVELENSNMVKLTNIGFTFPTKWDFNTVFKFNSALAILRKDSSLDLNIKIPEFDEGISVVFADYHELTKDKKQKKTLFISYDLGGGTLDIAAAIMWQTRKGLNCQDHGRLVGYSGDNSLGGDLITEIISKLICDSIVEILSNEDSVKTLLQTKKAFEPEIGKIDYLKVRIYFPNHYSNKWNRGKDHAFDTEKLKRYIDQNSYNMYDLADKTKIDYFKNINGIVDNSFALGLFIGLFVVHEDNGVEKISSHNIQIGLFPQIFPDRFNISIDSFLDYQFSLFGSQSTARQKFLKSHFVLRNFIGENIDEVDCVRIILAGNGSRFQFVFDSIAKVAGDINIDKKIDKKIEVIPPYENAKKLAALGHAKKMAGRMTGDFFPVYSVIQNSLFFTKTDIDDPELKQIFEAVFEPFEPFGKNLLGDCPSFAVLKSRNISIVLADQYMVVECQQGHEFNIYSEKKDIPEYVVGRVFISNDLDTSFKKTKIIDGEEYPYVDVAFDLHFSKSNSDLNGFGIRAICSAFFIGPADQRCPAVMRLNGCPDSDYLSNILLMRE